MPSLITAALLVTAGGIALAPTAAAQDPGCVIEGEGSWADICLTAEPDYSVDPDDFSARIANEDANEWIRIDEVNQPLGICPTGDPCILPQEITAPVLIPCVPCLTETQTIPTYEVDVDPGISTRGTEVKPGEIEEDLCTPAPSVCELTPPDPGDTDPDDYVDIITARPSGESTNTILFGDRDRDGRVDGLMVDATPRVENPTWVYLERGD